jgi:hypothetical protein
VKKKVADDIKSMLSTLLILGRSYNIHIIIGLQRADAEHFKAGARDQFGAVLRIGNLSKKQRLMLFNKYRDEMVGDYTQGTGYFMRDGQGIKRVVVPTVRDIKLLNKTILLGLSQNIDD